MHVLLTGGGTAGHINPAIAIAEILRARLPDVKISFVGTPSGMENRLVSREGYPIYHIKTMGFSRSLNPKNLVAAYRAWKAPKDACKLLRQLQPDIVIGTGGYVCWAPLKAAAALGIPCMVHESNAVPGLAVRRLEKHLDRILLNFEETKAHLSYPDKAVTVGNPLRGAFASADRRAVRAALGLCDTDKLILAFGGSLGAAELNRACLSLARQYVLPHEHVHMIHGCGERNFEACRRQLNTFLPRECKRITLRGYLDNVPELMQAADMVIARAGAMTLSELSLAGCAAILIPSPNVVNNHQYKNAKVLADAGAALLLEEGEGLDTRLIDNADRILTDQNARLSMSRSIRSFARRDVGDVIFHQIISLAKKEN